MYQRATRDRSGYFDLLGLVLAFTIGTTLFAGLLALGRSAGDAWGLVAWPLGAGGSVIALVIVCYFVDVYADMKKAAHEKSPNAPARMGGRRPVRPKSTENRPSNPRTRLTRPVEAGRTDPQVADPRQRPTRNMP